MAKKKSSKKKSSQPAISELLENMVFFTIYKDTKGWAAKTLKIEEDDLVLDTIYKGGARYTMAYLIRAIKQHVKKLLG